MSTTAMGITGDIKTTRNELIIQGNHLKLALVKELDGEGLIDASNLLDATLNGSTKGQLYRTYLPALTRLHGTNRLCGQQPTTWVVVLHTVDREGGVNLDLAFFSGNKQPNLTPAAISTSKDLCGTFWYQQ